MEKTHAGFRALRESLGLSLSDVADAMGVRERSVRRWEACGDNYPPDDAWEWLDGMQRRFDEGVDASLDAAEESGAKRMSITYYRSQEEYDAFGRDAEPYGFVNAISREVALTLEANGVEVALMFPEEADAALTSAIMLTRD